MGIVLTRIDDRLIHGQILEAWVPSLNVDCIVIGNDLVAGNSFHRKLISASVPKNLEVRFGSIVDLKQVLYAGEMQKRRILLLFNSSEDALKAFKEGVALSDINLGNLHGGPGGAKITCSIFLHEDDIENLSLLEKSGVKVSIQCVPTDRPESWDKLISNRVK